MIDNKKISDLYDSLAKELIIYIYSFVRSRENAEDILHDAFIRLLIQVQNEKVTDINLRAMLYTISRNICIDHLRKNKRNEITLLDENLTASGREMIEDLSAAELQEKINSFLETSDPVSRSVFIMKKELMLTYEEIAKRLKISERTAKRKMKKVTENLISHLRKSDFLQS
jgi:RNA polymerase sigma factor (sigma-70 family)